MDLSAKVNPSGGMFNDIPSRALRFALSGLSQRLQTISNNVANVDTPGFTAQKVNFEDTLQSALAGPGFRMGGLTLLRDTPNQLPGLADVTGQPTPAVVANLENPPRNDGNNVNIDKEMTSLSETGLTYSAAGQLMTMRLGQLRTA